VSSCRPTALNLTAGASITVALPTKSKNRCPLDIALIILLLGFPLPGDPHVGDRYDTCVQDFSPGGRCCLHLSGGGSPNQHRAERGAGTDLLDLSRKIGKLSL
jgi:hypothetical protein